MIGSPFRLGSHEPKHFSLRAVLDGLLQQRFQRVPGSVVLLEVGGSKPDGLALGEDGERVREDGASAFESALPDASLGVFHPGIEHVVKAFGNPDVSVIFFKTFIFGIPDGTLFKALYAINIQRFVQFFD